MCPRKTSVEIDEDLLAAVQKALSTTTIRATIEEAFREILRTVARREEVESLREMRGLDLYDPEVLARAWRT